MIHALLSAVLAGVMYVALASTALNASAGVKPNTVDHLVGFGETLGTLAQVTSTDAAQLARMNALTLSRHLQEGQTILLPQHPSAALHIHRVVPHETVTSIAAQHAISPQALRRANRLSCSVCLATGQILRIPVTAQEVASALPYPLVNIRLSSVVPQQGDVLIVRVQTNNATRVEGQFGAQRIRFSPEEGIDGGRFVGLVGLDAMVRPASYNLAITATTSLGGAGWASGNILVKAGQYFLEQVTIADELMPLLDETLNANEEWEIKRIYSGYSPTQWWSGPFMLPVVGRLVSGYGNPRAYNGLNLGTYHTGYDISALAGTPVSAAAPGRVVAVRPYAIRGLSVVIDHGRGVFTGYFHLSQASVNEGQMVDRGETVGTVGNTGRSQGPHVHFDLAVGGVTVDPGYWTKVALP